MLPDAQPFVFCHALPDWDPNLGYHDTPGLRRAALGESLLSSRDSGLIGERYRQWTSRQHAHGGRAGVLDS